MLKLCKVNFNSRDAYRGLVEGFAVAEQLVADLENRVTRSKGLLGNKVPSPDTAVRELQQPKPQMSSGCSHVKDVVKEKPTLIEAIARSQKQEPPTSNISLLELQFLLHGSALSLRLSPAFKNSIRNTATFQTTESPPKTPVVNLPLPPIVQYGESSVKVRQENKFDDSRSSPKPREWSWLVAFLVVGMALILYDEYKQW
eukprot:TRINITY_DN30518_c0_g1_i1.p1 TRINITY_DN30518_c0_g1~~TRINITY_DN30518_c0_g1_i1.p1  ORF type:complete len:200 (+),score=23.04 TRINITY_DN30518_c0_g1_i1:116-715(+)